MRYLKHILLLSVIVFIHIGCGLKVPHTVVPDYKDRTPRSIAVLPVQNETVDMDAPKIFRRKLFNVILHRGYVSPSISVIDSKLAEKGIREPGQLGSMAPQEMGEYLNVDAVLYSTVTEWSTTYLVVYASIKVEGRFQLIDTKTGEQLWESEHEVSEKRFGTDKNSMKNSLDFATLQGYDPYVHKVIRMAFSTLPNGPRYVPHSRGDGCLGP